MRAVPSRQSSQLASNATRPVELMDPRLACLPRTGRPSRESAKDPVSSLNVGVMATAFGDAPDGFDNATPPWKESPPESWTSTPVGWAAAEAARKQSRATSWRGMVSGVDLPPNRDSDSDLIISLYFF